MRRIVVSTAFVAALALSVLVSVKPANSQGKSKAASKGPVAAPAPYGNVDSIREEEMKIYLYFLASDQMEGRNLPSRGFDAAALYVASHLAEWGLKPGGSTSGTLGPLQPYFMPMELVAKSVIPEQSKASITGPAAGGGGRGRGGAGGGQAGGGQGGGGGARGGAGPQTTNFEYIRDWSIAAGGRGGPPLEALDVSANLVFAGNGYVINKTKTNPYEGLDVKGKIIVVAGLPAELAAQQAAAGRGGRGGRGNADAVPAAGDAPAGSAQGGGNPPAAATNPLGEACTDFLSPEQYAAKNGALAVVTIANYQQVAAMANPNAAAGFGAGGGRASLNGPAYTVPKLQASQTCPSAPGVTAGLAMTNAIFQGEKMSGQQVFYGAGANSKQESFDLAAAKKINLKIAVKSEQNHAENIIGILEGSDPVLKNEYVVISAHLDHTGFATPLPDGDNINNGADDDGSGSAGLMALARAYSEGAAKGMRPKRSMIFAWLAGEEKGLWGSQYMTQYPFLDLSKVVANLNMDMIGRTKVPGFTDSDATHVLVNPNEILVVGPNISSDDLEKTIETVNNGYLKMTLNHFYDVTAPDATHDNLGPQPRGQRIFYRSDHYNFAKMGIPIAFFTTGLHPDYHRPTDTADKIDYKQMQTVSRTMGAVGWVLATQTGRPQLNAKLPEQLIKDMKAAKDQNWGTITPVMPPLPGMPY
ncbi:MAG: M28 family peptidase [Candidatus Solibacter sp.]